MRVLRQNLRSFALWGFSRKLMEKNHLIKKIKELAYFSNKIRIVSQKKIVGTLRVKKSENRAYEYPTISKKAFKLYELLLTSYANKIEI